MRLAPGVPLSLALAFDPRAPVQTGRLALEGGSAQLEWSRDVVATGLPVAALYYPPEAGLHPARGRDFEGLHGFLADSLPEGWGRRLLRRRLAKVGIDITTLSPLEMLALVGDHGRGALVYTPATTPIDEIETLDLDALAHEAAAVIAGGEGELADTLAGLAGGSGGARPKVYVGLSAEGQASVGEGEMPPGFEAWLVKFRAPEDPEDIGPIEEAYARMAEKAGLVMSAHRLIPARRGPGYFAAERFDRTADGGRLHMVSLAGAIEAPTQPGATSYDMFLRATGAITRRRPDVQAVFRRAVFNVLACNRDDHTRQHAFLMDRTGNWRLAPAYDLTYSPGPGGEHYLDVEGEGRNPAIAHVERLGGRHGLEKRAVGQIVDQVRAAVDSWPELAADTGVGASSLREIANAHARIGKAFASH